MKDIFLFAPVKGWDRTCFLIKRFIIISKSNSPRKSIFFHLYIMHPVLIWLTNCFSGLLQLKLMGHALLSMELIFFFYSHCKTYWYILSISQLFVFVSTTVSRILHLINSFSNGILASAMEFLYCTKILLVWYKGDDRGTYGEIHVQW